MDICGHISAYSCGGVSSGIIKCSPTTSSSGGSSGSIISASCDPKSGVVCDSSSSSSSSYNLGGFNTEGRIFLERLEGVGRLRDFFRFFFRRRDYIICAVSSSSTSFKSSLVASRPVTFLKFLLIVL